MECLFANCWYINKIWRWEVVAVDCEVRVCQCVPFISHIISSYTHMPGCVRSSYLRIQVSSAFPPHFLSTASQQLYNAIQTRSMTRGEYFDYWLPIEAYSNTIRKICYFIKFFNLMLLRPDLYFIKCYVLVRKLCMIIWFVLPCPSNQFTRCVTEKIAYALKKITYRI